MRKIQLLILLLALFLGASSALAADPKKPDPKKGDPKAADAAAAPTPPPIEYGRICQADVSYLWQLEATETEAGGYARKVFYATVSEQGSLVEDIKSKLNARLASVQSQAIAACRGDHQSKSGCVLKKLTNISASFPALDFASRQVTMNSVRRDCNQRIGQCLSTQVSEMKCWLYVPSEAVIQDEPKIHVEQGPLPEIEEIDEPDDTDAPTEATAPTTDPNAAPPKIVVGKPAPVKRPKPKRQRPEDKNAAPNASPTPETNPYNQPFTL